MAVGCELFAGRISRLGRISPDFRVGTVIHRKRLKQDHFARVYVEYQMLLAGLYSISAERHLL